MSFDPRTRLREELDENTRINDRCAVVVRSDIAACLFVVMLIWELTPDVHAMPQEERLDLTGVEHNAAENLTGRMVVTVRPASDGSASYHVENKPVSISALTADLARAKIHNPDQAVLIRGDPNAKWENVAAVMGCCAHAGISRMSARSAIQEKK